MDKQTQIGELIEANPRHYSRMIAKRPDLAEWVNDNCLVDTDNFAEKIYSALNKKDNRCVHGQIKKFTDISTGYRNCGPAGKCECARLQVSANVRSAKLNQTADQRQQSLELRRSTNLERYGVLNVGQTAAARQRHADYYAAVRKPKRKSLSSYEKLNKKFQRFNIRFLTPESLYTGVSNQVYYEFECQECSNQFRDYIDNGHIPKCRVCNPYKPEYVSGQETAVYEFVAGLVPDAEQSNKKIIAPYELDIVVPSKKLAIEYCGLFWHSEYNQPDPNYHANKLKLCKQQGLRLITIFEDEWTHRRPIVENRLRAILGATSKIYARKCLVNPIAIALAREFTEQHHIQGHSQCRYAYGCFFEGKLVAVMTFGRPRYNRHYEYELIRYASIGTVVGGAGRLLSAFVKQHDPKNIISYCDLRWGTGNLYQRLGFEQVKANGVGYSYTDFVQRYHRSKFTKSSLVKNGADPNLSEHEIMREKKMYRIWDCGVGCYVNKFSA